MAVMTPLDEAGRPMPTPSQPGTGQLQAETHPTDRRAQELSQRGPVTIHPSPPGALPHASAPPFVQAQTSIGIDFGLLKYVKRLAMSE
jgi:hypothetical protein